MRLYTNVKESQNYFLSWMSNEHRTAPHWLQLQDHSTVVSTSRSHTTAILSCILARHQGHTCVDTAIVIGNRFILTAMHHYFRLVESHVISRDGHVTDHDARITQRLADMHEYHRRKPNHRTNKFYLCVFSFRNDPEMASSRNCRILLWHFALQISFRLNLFLVLPVSQPINFSHFPVESL